MPSFASLATLFLLSSSALLVNAGPVFSKRDSTERALVSRDDVEPAEPWVNPTTGLYELNFDSNWAQPAQGKDSWGGECPRNSKAKKERVMWCV